MVKNHEGHEGHEVLGFCRKTAFTWRPAGEKLCPGWVKFITAVNPSRFVFLALIRDLTALFSRSNG
jgi:hypothetical protein